MYFFAAGITYGIYCISLTLYDLNSTRVLLKKENLDKYFIKKQEHSKIVGRIGNMAKYPEDATLYNISKSLDDLRVSPFYDSKYNNSYKNLRILQINRTEYIDKSRLYYSNEKCTKEELMKDLYTILSD